MRPNERRAMAVLGALQGLALWLLHETWPEAPRWAALSAAGTYFVCASGLVLHMARSGRDIRRLVTTALAVGAAFGAVAWWVGWQLPPQDAAFEGDALRAYTWAAGAAIAIFVLGPFVQIHQRTGRLRFPYTELYRHSWNDFFVAALALVHVGALWAVLLLQTQLFELIGIGFFEDAFTEPVFVFTATGSAVGYGLAAARESERVIGALRSITQALLRAVLPVLCAMTLAFLATLPFTGLEEMFGRASAATVLIGWLVAGIVLLNAVYLDGSDPPPYAALTRRVVEAGVVATPVLAGLALYALALRIGQHGLTPPRMYGLLLALVLSLYALGYAAAVLARSDPWLARLRPVNVTIAWVWIALAFALHTPLLDPLRWSLSHQLARLESGRVAPEAFDYGYLRFRLGWRGAEALERLADAAQDPDVRDRIAHARSAESYWTWRQNEAWGGEQGLVFERIPADAPWPPGLRAAIEATGSRGSIAEWCRDGAGGTCVATPHDLDGDGTAEEILFIRMGSWLHAHVFARNGSSHWRKVGVLRDTPSNQEGIGGGTSLIAAVRAGEVALVPPRHRDLEVAGRRLSFDRD